MLPLPNLDDRYFDEMVKEARKMISGIIPEWTDENDHDPGITFIELFAWLTEMQQYYMNRIAKQSEKNFLQLMGVTCRPLSSAKVDTAFGGVHKRIILPKGTKLAAHDLIFETDERCVLLPNSIEKIIVLDHSEANDYTSLNQTRGASYFAFGSQARKGSTLYIGLQQPLPIEEEISLTVNMFENYPVPIGNGGDASATNIIPSGKVSWKYFGMNTDVNQSKKGWYPLEIIEDQTFHMSKSGKVKLKIPFEMIPERVHPANEENRYWLSCTVEQEGFEIPPRIYEIRLNTTMVTHQDTLSESNVYPSNGVANDTIEITNYLAVYENVNVQVKTPEGYWQYWKKVVGFEECGPGDGCYKISIDKENKKAIITFGDGQHGKIPPKGSESIKVITYSSNFIVDRLLGMSNGLPNQSFELYDLDIIPESLTLQIGRRISGYDDLMWEDWHRVEDLMATTSCDKTYMFDKETGKFYFGNNENALIPPDSDVTNICITDCRVGGGPKGNIKYGLINRFLSEDEEFIPLTVTNYNYASGGRAAESINDTKLRLQRDLKLPTRAITSDDYEYITKQTPGLRVGRVKAIPLYTPGLKEYPKNKVPAQVTVVVVPYSESPKPVPSQGFLDTIKHYLNEHRLLTTELHVIPPEYIKVTIYASVVVEPFLKDDPSKIEKALEQLLHPLDRHNASGWEFGRAVYKGDIYGVINNVEGVVFIKDLWIEGEGRGIQKEPSGNIQIPPHGLVYSGKHQIEVISKTDL